MEMPTTSARVSLSLWDLVVASSVAEDALRHANDHHADDLHASFSVLLDAITTASPLPTTPPAQPTKEAPAKDKQTLRRERNRLSCRKARLKRKLERLGESLLVRVREQRQADLLDLRDELTAGGGARANPQRAVRMFVAKSLHYALLDDEYMALKQRDQAPERLVLGWPTRALTASMVKQWQRITSDVANAQLTIEETTETTKGSGKSASVVLQCAWTLRGVSHSGVEKRCREEPMQYDGKTVLRFVNGTVESIQMSVTAKKMEPQREGEDDEETESEPEEEDQHEEYEVIV